MLDDLTLHLTATEPPPGGHNVLLEYEGATEYGAFRLAAVAEALAQLKAALTDPQPAAETLKAAGATLFEELLGGQLFRAYTRALARSTTQRRKVRLRIHTNQPDLIAIPWEYLYDRDQAQWLALHSELMLVRGLPLPQQTPQPVTGPLRVLLMLSAPNDLQPLNSARELASLQSAEATGLIEVIPVAPTYADLQSALRQQQPHIFHFVGHGTFSQAPAAQATGDPPAESQGLLVFCTPEGAAELIEADRLAPLLADCATLGLVLLNACEGAVTGTASAFAGLTQRLLQQQIPAVIAMQATIVDDHAARFSQEFYAALAEGRGVEQAMSEGRKRIHEVAYTWGIPTFYLQAAEPFAIQPLAPSERADRLWQKAQRTPEAARRRQLLAGALALVPNHAGAQAGLARLQTEEEASHLYAAAVRYMEQQAWRDAQRALEQTEKRLPNFRDTRTRLAEVLGKLPASAPRLSLQEIDQAEQYLPIRNALLEGRLTFFLGGEVGRIGRPPSDGWVAGLYPPGADDAARMLAQHLPVDLQGETSLLQVSQYTVMHEGEPALFARLNALYTGDYAPTMLHRLLAELPKRLQAKGYPKSTSARYVLFSSALDDLLERAFGEAEQPFHLFAYRPRWVDDDGVTHAERFFHTPALATTASGQLPEAIEVLEPNTYNRHDSDNHPIIVKLCGRRVSNEPDSVVVTEDHYLHYLSAEKSLAVLPPSLLTRIKRNNFLFFGHSLQPWHLRLLWQRLRLPASERQPPRWAIVPELNRKEELFWRSQRIEPLVAQPEGVVAYVNDWVNSL